jgi:hypothetical protein
MSVSRRDDGKLNNLGPWQAYSSVMPKGVEHNIVFLSNERQPRVFIRDAERR